VVVASAASTPRHPLSGEATQGCPAVLRAAWPLAGSRARSSRFLGSSDTPRKMFAISKKCSYSFCFVDVKYLPGCSGTEKITVSDQIH